MAVLLDLSKIVPIPHEPGQTLTIRRISKRQLKAAGEEATVQAIQRFKAFGGGEMLEAFGKMVDPAKREEAKKAEALDPASGLDVDTLIKAGLTGWSYNVTFTPEHVEQLDDETEAFAAKQIAMLAKGWIEEARGNA